MIIYKARNKLNEKCYIGQTTLDLDTRKALHLYDATAGSRGAFQVAIRKHGFTNFEWSILAECSSLEELDKLEADLIISKNTLIPHGYNSKRGGHRLWLAGAKFGEITVISFSHYAKKGRDERRTVWDVRCSCGKEFQEIGSRLTCAETTRCTECTKAYRKSPEYAESCRQASIKALNTPEMHEKLSKATKEVANRPEVKAALIARQTGRKLSEEHKENIQKGVREAAKRPEVKKALREARRGKAPSEETKAKIRQGVLKHFRDNPEARANLSGKMKNPETQTKLQEANRSAKERK